MCAIFSSQSKTPAFRDDGHSPGPPPARAKQSYGRGESPARALPAQAEPHRGNEPAPAARSSQGNEYSSPTQRAPGLLVQIHQAAYTFHPLIFFLFLLYFPRVRLSANLASQ